jgi:hypothetical protein
MSHKPYCASELLSGASYVTDAEADSGPRSCQPETIEVQRVEIDGSFSRFQEEALIYGDCGEANDLYFVIWAPMRGKAEHELKCALV